MADEKTRGDVNQLYWGSDASVAEIADQLGISRRALYDAIEPRPAGTPCPACGGALGYRNRTAAERWEAECADCGEATSTGRDAAQPRPAAPETQPLGPRRTVRDAGSAGVGSALLAGLVAGAVAGILLKRR